MIYCLTGTLLEKSLDNVVIDVQGVGFSLAVPSTVQGVLPAVGEKCTLYTYLSVKEDALDLYGFADKAEQKEFKTLIVLNSFSDFTIHLQKAVEGMGLESFYLCLCGVSYGGYFTRRMHG